MRLKVFTFRKASMAGRPSLAGYADSAEAAALILGSPTAITAAIKKEGLSYIDPRDSAALAAWNRPITIPNVSW